MLLCIVGMIVASWGLLLRSDDMPSFYAIGTLLKDQPTVFGEWPPLMMRGIPCDIDVIIPCHDKDQETLEYAIDGIKKHGIQVRRVIVVSERKMTNKAEWFPESRFPFSLDDIKNIFNESNHDSSRVASSRSGWYFQQLIKLYAWKVIPDISAHILVLDADTIFLRPVIFTDPDGSSLFNPGTEYHVPYFRHMRCFLPGLNKQFSAYSGISHHMLFCAPILKIFFDAVESYHHDELWKVFCRCVDVRESSGASEFELYFNFVFSRKLPGRIRKLVWANISKLSAITEYYARGYDYVSCHAYLRKELPELSMTNT